MTDSDKSNVYDGPVCYVGHDEAGPDGKLLEGGWHYSVRVDEEHRDLALHAAKMEVQRAERSDDPDRLARAREILSEVEAFPFQIPDEKLFLDAKTGQYRLARGGDRSWHERHHKQYTLIAPGGNVGVPETPEQVETAIRHFDNLEERLGERGLDAHEHDHIYTSPDEIAHMRRYLKANPRGVSR